MHVASDPGGGWIKPSKDEEKKYSISYSQWLGSKEAYLREVAECEFYLSPRVKEGIGFSFLEAMAMGKIVIANNAPTMNEYIVDGVNGCLFDYRRPEAASVGDVERLSTAARESVQEGYARWQRDTDTILDFIERRTTSSFAGPSHRGTTALWVRHLHAKFVAAAKMAAGYAKAAAKAALPYATVLRYQGRDEEELEPVKRLGLVGILPYAIGKKLCRRRRPTGMRI